jgi:hypothetical protein
LAFLLVFATDFEGVLVNDKICVSGSYYFILYPHLIEEKGFSYISDIGLVANQKLAYCGISVSCFKFLIKCPHGFGVI